MSRKLTPLIFIKILCALVSIVIIWRGIWHLLDVVDVVYLHGNTIWTSLGGIIIGIILLYLPDKDLKEIDYSGLTKEKTKKR